MEHLKKLFPHRAKKTYHLLTKKFDNAVSIPLAQLMARYRKADIAFFFKFKGGPYGGGNQFLKALWWEIERRQLKLENNTISHVTRACLFNSHNFDVDRLRRLAHPGCKFVHRVDGPLSIYRGSFDDSDKRILQLNQEFADATVFQSFYSLKAHEELGMVFKSPHVIPNAANPAIFHPKGRVNFNFQRKIRLIAVSWSDNKNKGASILKWIEDHLKWDRFDFTFVGRSPIQFERISMVPPLPSHKLAEILRYHDIYIAPSKHDSCSNALMEALSCGLPAIYLNSGGHPEIVKEAGFGFTNPEETIDLIEHLVKEYDFRQSKITIPTIEEVADKYLSILGFK